MSSAAPSATSALPPAPSLAEAERYCLRALPAASRTFALSIRALRGELRRAVLAAYLVCRIADTVEDTASLSADDKAALLERLLGCLDDPAGAAAFSTAASGVGGDPAHVDLLAHADHVFALYAALPGRTREVVARWAGEMIRGMRAFVLRYPGGIRIQTLEEYREYCYYVAGTVGYMLTDLWYEHSRPVGDATYRVLRERCRAFAEALQTVNILKDVAQDAERENAIYIPERALQQHGSSHATLLSPGHRRQNEAALAEIVALARQNLDEALAYLTDLPRRALTIRIFCVLPLLFAHATLRDLTRSTAMLVSGGVVKISRAEVKSLLVVGPLAALSNRAVRWLVRRVRTRAFVLAPAASRG